LRELREAGCSHQAICALRLGEVSTSDDTIMIRRPGGAPAEGGSAAVLRHYLERRAELALDCDPSHPLIVDLEGQPFSAERLHTHYQAARTVRVAMEANGSFCRALLSMRRRDAAAPSGHEQAGGKHVPS
jgi:hypothetical protein